MDEEMSERKNRERGGREGFKSHKRVFQSVKTLETLERHQKRARHGVPADGRAMLGASICCCCFFVFLLLLLKQQRPFAVVVVVIVIVVVVVFLVVVVVGSRAMLGAVWIVCKGAAASICNWSFHYQPCLNTQFLSPPLFVTIDLFAPPDLFLPLPPGPGGLVCT